MRREKNKLYFSKLHFAFHNLRSSFKWPVGFPGGSDGKEVKSGKVAQLCPILWNSPGQNTGVGSLSLLQRIFLTQESNWGLLHCRRILYQLSYEGSPQTVQNLSAVQETQFQSLGWEDPLEKNSMDRGAWQGTVQGIAKSRTWLSN